MDSNYSRYTDFLKDRRFIRWQLMPDENLDAYWRNFMERHPQYDKEMRKAIMYLKKEGLNKNRLADHERTALFETIQKSILEKKKIKQREFVWYSSVASVAVALVVIGITLFSPSPEHIIAPDKELIVGKLLNSEDIQLITSEETISFRNDVEVTLDNEGTAEITESNNETSKISISRDKLNSLVVPYGKRSSLTLADGSRVWLNSGSVLEFPARFMWKKTRNPPCIGRDVHRGGTGQEQAVSCTDYRLQRTGIWNKVQYNQLLRIAKIGGFGGRKRQLTILGDERTLFNPEPTSYFFRQRHL